jgi:hypothetical protein
MHDTRTRPAPGAIIGYLKSGRPVRLQAGGSEAITEAPPADPAAAPPAAPPEPQQPAAPRVPAGQPEGGQFASAAPPAPAAVPPAPAPVPAAPAAAEPDWKAQAESLKAETERLKAEADRWKQQSRTQEQRSKANHAELRNRDAVLRQIAEKVGIEFDDKPDPEELTRKLDQAQQTARQRTVELSVFQTAAESGANASALLDSREFMARTAQLDPDAADFPSQVADLVREAAKQAKFQAAAPPAPAPAAGPAPVQQQAPASPPQQQVQPPAQPPAPSSGADFSGAPGGNRLWTQADYDHWTKPGMDRDGSIMAKAIEQGLLVNLGIGKPRRPTRR